MSKHRIVLFAAVAAAVCMLPAAALANMPTGIFSEIAGHPTAQVPGHPAGTYFDAFDRPYRSPDGSRWIINGSTNAATTMDEVLIVGAGPTNAGATLAVREGDPAPWAPGETIGLFDRNISINDAGHIAFQNNTSGGSSSFDDYIVKYDGAYTVIAQEGTSLPAPNNTESYGSTLDSPSINNAGDVAFRAPSTTGTLLSSQDDFLFAGTTVVAQSGVTIPGNQAGGTSRAWDLFDTQDYYYSNGADYMAQGDLTGSTSDDDVLVVNGNVVIQEDSILPGFAEPVSAILESVMTPNGDWMARGDNDVTGSFNSGQDWVIFNGSTVAKTGDLVPGGLPGETFDDTGFSATFFSMTANNLGDYVIGGTTSNVDPLADAVLVLNGTEVVARQGDPVDLDGNGLFDDDTYIDVFNNDDAFLTDDLTLYFTATLINGAGSDLGQAFMALVVPEPTSVALLALGGLAILRRRR